MQVVSGCELRDERQAFCSFMGLPLVLAPQHLWPVSLVVTMLVVPEASFTGHMCGVLAGLLHSYVLRPGMGQGSGAGWLQGQGSGAGFRFRAASRAGFRGNGRVA